MGSRFRKPGLALVALACCILACLPCQTSSQLLPTPERTVPVSTEDAEELAFSLSHGIVPDAEGRFTLVITEEELTSYVALNMRESIVDPQVLLTNGQICIYGTMVSPIEAPLTTVATVEVDNGSPRLVIESVSVDGYPIPDTFVEAFAHQIDDLISAARRSENAEISEVEIREGEMIIRGRVKS
jgi:hypothetical protein